MNNIHTLLLEHREQLALNGFKAPWIIVLDIDSTIINTRKRNQAIVDAAYKTNPQWFKKKPLLNNEVWDVCEVLRQTGVLLEENVSFLRNFWEKRFFENEWLNYDEPYPFVKDCLYTLKKDGFAFVYLTGRDQPGMGQGTRKSFSDNKLPITVEDEFMFKPAFEIPDTEFKKFACNSLKKRGTIVGTADNTSDNSNLFIQYFPDAYHFCFDTVTPPHSQPLNDKIIKLDISAWQIK